MVWDFEISVVVVVLIIEMCFARNYLNPQCI